MNADRCTPEESTWNMVPLPSPQPEYKKCTQKLCGRTRLLSYGARTQEIEFKTWDNDQPIRTVPCVKNGVPTICFVQDPPDFLAQYTVAYRWPDFDYTGGTKMIPVPLVQTSSITTIFRVGTTWNYRAGSTKTHHSWVWQSDPLYEEQVYTCLNDYRYPGACP